MIGPVLLLGGPHDGARLEVPAEVIRRGRITMPELHQAPVHDLARYPAPSVTFDYHWGGWDPKHTAWVFRYRS